MFFGNQLTGRHQREVTNVELKCNLTKLTMKSEFLCCQVVSSSSLWCMLSSIIVGAKQHCPPSLGLWKSPKCPPPPDHHPCLLHCYVSITVVWGPGMEAHGWVAGTASHWSGTQSRDLLASKIESTWTSQAPNIHTVIQLCNYIYGRFLCPTTWVCLQ